MDEIPGAQETQESSKEALDARFEFRLSAEEKNQIAEKARLAGLKPTEYVRRTALGAEVKERLPVELRRYIGGVANNLNQLTRLAHAGKLSASSASELSHIAKALLALIQS